MRIARTLKRWLLHNFCFILPVAGVMVFLWFASRIEPIMQVVHVTPVVQQKGHLYSDRISNDVEIVAKIEKGSIKVKLQTQPKLSQQPSNLTASHQASYKRTPAPIRLQTVHLKGELEIQNQRQRMLEERCTVHHKRLKSSRSWAYKLNLKYKYLFCPIPKAGWSSWKRMWFYMSGAIKSLEEDPGNQDDKIAGVKDIGLLGTRSAYKTGRYNYSFVFVRNPWERLVSAYTNKAVDYNYTRVMHTPCRWERMEPYKEDLTFEQFITCIGQGLTRDPHWQPQTRLCDLCGIHYDFLGRMETIREDASAVLKVLNINTSYPHAFSSKKYNTHESLREMYKSIPIEVLRAVYRWFYYDFQLLGYDSRPPGRSDIDFSDISL